MRLDRVKDRDGLSIRRDPYWQRLSAGRYIGYRRMTEGSEGTWLARMWDGSRYVYPKDKLGEFSDLPKEARFDAAKTAAEKWFQHVDLGGSTTPTSVKATCERYLEYLEAEKSLQAAKDARGYFRRFVFGDPDLDIKPDPIAKIMLSKLTKPHMAAFRERMLAHNADRSSFNRNVTPLRAALNLARKEGKVATDQAWLMALQPFSDKQMQTQKPRRRKGTLDRAERRQLVEAASDEARPFFKALALLPMRPGEIASLRVDYLNTKDKALEIDAGKGEARIIPLPREAFEHFKECAKDKLPAAWLISRADGSQWKKEAWRDEVKAAVRKAKLPKGTVAYTLRHSLITELVKDGLDIFTVAKLAGTSVRMIEKHYGHLQREHARSALEKLALA